MKSSSLFAILGLLLWQTVAAEALRIYSDRPLAATVSAWIEDFQSAYPNAKPTLVATTTLTAVQALLNRQAEVVALSRTLTSAEARILQSPPPLAVPVGLDALGIIVHPQDPRQHINLADLEYQFGGTQRCQRHLPTTSLLPRALYAPTPANASHFHFQTKVLCGGSLRQEVVLLEDDAEVIAKVSHQPGALGFASQSLVKAEVRLLPVISGTSPAKVLPRAEHLTDGRYPLAYYLYLYLQPDPLALAFARAALVPKGQAILAHHFVPLPELIRQKALERLERTSN
jgi:phosphate transport system substrate-binding protein